MEVVNFYPNTFSEIPVQDNPAFLKDECLMMVCEDDNLNNGDYRCVVLYNKPKGIQEKTVKGMQIAVFWSEEIAGQFCDNFDPENL